jgi:transcriptional regulator with XRE-family HTH domain
MTEREPFGAALRRARLAVPVSLAWLSERVHYSKGHLSKVENGTKRPTLDLAVHCDAALGTGGRLAALLSRQPRPRPAPAAAPPGPVEPSGTYMLADDDVSTPAALEDLLRHTRTLGIGTSPRLVLPGLVAQTRTVQELARDARSPARERLLVVAARYAEYAGWMAQEAGDEPGARHWTEQAVRLADAARDPDLLRYCRVRQAELSLYRGDVRTALELLAGVRGDGSTARVAGLAAQWEAQAHAVDGNAGLWRAAMDRSAELLAVPDASASPLGPSSAPNMPALVVGWSLVELGRPEEAAELLDRQVPLVPAQARRAAARFGVRRAMAHAAAGSPETAVALLPDLLPLTRQVDSATVTGDLRRLHRTLTRWDHRPAVAEGRTALRAAVQR